MSVNHKRPGCRYVHTLLLVEQLEDRSLLSAGLFDPFPHGTDLFSPFSGDSSNSSDPGTPNATVHPVHEATQATESIFTTFDRYTRSITAQEASLPSTVNNRNVVANDQAMSLLVGNFLAVVNFPHALGAGTAQAPNSPVPEKVRGLHHEPSPLDPTTDLLYVSSYGSDHILRWQ
jgi:hypothetical protein